MSKISFISTVFNEEKTVGKFLQSILAQSKLPDEICIVDGRSSDQTVAEIKNEKLKMKNYNVKFKIIIKKGNRSVGRNEAIRNTTGNIIVCSDAGCILDRNWVKKIIEPFNDPEVDVVAGYYKGKPKSIFEKCLIPYVLVMEDKVNPDNFLPASRSMAFKKDVWKKVKGFPEEFSNNEDYVFAHKLKKKKFNIFFERNAIVYWIPRKNFKEAFVMFFRFALGDAQSLILRPKVFYLFVRYFIGLYLLLLYIFTRSGAILFFNLMLLGLYLGWSIAKNYSYVNNFKAILILPLLQLISDIAVLVGTSWGLFKRKSYS